MAELELASHIAALPEVNQFDAWVSTLAQFGHQVQIHAAWAAADASSPIWSTYDAALASHSGAREVAEAIRSALAEQTLTVITPSQSSTSR